MLVGALVVDSLGNGLFVPLSLVFFTRITTVPLSVVGVLLSVATLLTLPLPVWVGTLADRVGALPLVVAAQVLQAAGYLGYQAVRGPVGILVTATAVAVGVRVFWSAVFTAIADYADGSGSPASKDTWYAWANMARTAGLAAGGLVTGLVIADGREVAYRAVGYASAACFTVAAGTIAAFVRAPRPHHDAVAEAGPGYRVLLRDRPFLALTGINTVFAMSSMMLAPTLPFVIIQVMAGPAWLTAPLLAGNTVLVAVLAAPVIARLRPYRRTRVLVAAAALWAGWSALLAVLEPGRLAWTVPLLVAATLLYTAAETMHAPVSMALAADIAPSHLRGRYLAVFQYSFTIAGIVAPTFFTVLFSAGHPLPWLALAGLNAASIAAVLLLERHLPATARPQPAAQPAG